jgi:hypothetical protein
MNRARIACLFGLAALALGASACTVGVGPGYSPDGEYPPGAYDDYPPDEYIATTEGIGRPNGAAVGAELVNLPTAAGHASISDRQDHANYWLT